MRLDDYFTDRPTKINDVTLQKIGLRQELKLLRDWSILVQSIESQQLTQRDVDIVNGMMSISCYDHPETTMENIEEQIVFVKQYIIDYIGLALSDPDIKEYFYIADGDTSQPPAYKGYIDYVAFVITQYGNDALDKINLSEAYILHRYDQIQESLARFHYIYDSMIAAHPSKEATGYISEIKKLTGIVSVGNHVPITRDNMNEAIESGRIKLPQDFEWSN